MIPHIKDVCADCKKEGFLDEMFQVPGKETRYKWICKQCSLSPHPKPEEVGK